MDFCGSVRVLEDVTYDKYADYGGRARKIGIIVDGMRYMVKFQGRETTRNADSVISEYLSSHIACAFGIPAHETMIVSIDGEITENWNPHTELSTITFNWTQIGEIDVPKYVNPNPGWTREEVTS